MATKKSKKSRAVLPPTRRVASVARPFVAARLKAVVPHLRGAIAHSELPELRSLGLLYLDAVYAGIRANRQPRNVPREPRRLQRFGVKRPGRNVPHDFRESLRAMEDATRQQNWSSIFQHTYLMLQALPGKPVYIPDQLPPPPDPKQSMADQAEELSRHAQIHEMLKG